jgi:hypothetical protein
MVLMVALALVVGFLFRDSFKAEMATFANDGPLGLMAAACNQFPQAWTGIWADLNWLGFNGGSAPPDLTSLLGWVLGPLYFIKFYPALTVIILGACAWLFFRQLNFHPAVCVLGGMAAALNSDFFSYACWGLGTLTLCVASIFLAFAALKSSLRPAWVRPVLAGIALGNALMEGFDNGAIFSLYVAAFAMFQAWADAGATRPARAMGVGLLRTAGVALASAIVAAHVLVGLVQLNISTVAGMSQQEEDRAARWSFATQWSLPPGESLRTVIPGLFGYRMDTPEGGQYWGKVGMHPAWDAYWAAENRQSLTPPPAPLRYSGAGHYAGVPVVLLALFAIAQSLHRGGGVFRGSERRWVWFWAVVALLSLLFAFGRFAPFYHLIYALPYFNTIRNPVKFLHPFNVALVVLFAYGCQALWRAWIEEAVARPNRIGAALKAWWASATRWERRWTFFSMALLGVSLLGWLVYGSSQDVLERHLAEVGFDPPDIAPIVRTSLAEVGLFVLVLALSVGLLLLAMSGWLGGRRSRMASLAFGLLLTLDLARANVPWVRHYNWQERYARNDLFDILSKAPHEARVTGQLPFDISRMPRDAAVLIQSLSSVYGIEWLQHQFRYFNIQSLDIVQLPREPADRAAYRAALRGHPLREWELGNTRYLLTLAPFVAPMNEQLDPGANRFRLHTAFTLSQGAEDVIHVQTNATGPFGLIEFTGALPRAMLFDQWRGDLPDSEVLNLLASTNFNPHTEVLVSEQIPAPAVSTTSQPAGTATFKSYAPRRFVIMTEARTPCVLLVNDKHDPNWRVLVDGREEPLLRANFIARGVYLTPGPHEVEFRFEPPVGTLWISLIAMLGGLGLCGYTLWHTLWHTQRLPSAIEGPPRTVARSASSSPAGRAPTRPLERR